MQDGVAVLTVYSVDAVRLLAAMDAGQHDVIRKHAETYSAVVQRKLLCRDEHL